MTLGRKVQWGLLVCMLVGAVLAVWCLGCSEATAPVGEKRVLTWSLSRDEAYQGDRSHCIEVQSVDPSGIRSLWFRFGEAGDPGGAYWTCYIFGSRAEAVGVIGSAVPLGTTDSYLKAVYSHLLPLTLTFTDGTVMEMEDHGTQTYPGEWVGEVFSYIRTVSLSLERSGSRPELKETLRKRYRPYSAR